MIIFLQPKYILTFFIIFSAAYIIDISNPEQKIQKLSEYIKKNDINITLDYLKSFFNKSYFNKSYFDKSYLNNQVNINNSLCALKPYCLCNDGLKFCFEI